MFQAVGPVLRIINALVRDRGVYICTAESSGGSAVTSAVVEVERKWLEATTAHSVLSYISFAYAA